MKLAEHLKKTAKKQTPMHMPGHKRREFAHLKNIDYQIDFTEIPDSDDLHHPEGILLESQRELAALYGANRSYYSVNGSTGCILSAIRAATKKGNKVIVARNCHKAVFNAIELCDLIPLYILPEMSRHGFFTSVDPEDVKKLLEREEGVALVIITSPTYEGVVSDVKSIAEICHGCGVPLLVDEAHGAHFGFFDPSRPSAVMLGADLVVQSFHKTLPSFTQTAVLHLSGDLVDAERLSAQMAVFQSSSPSYLLLSSLDGCCDYIREKGGRFEEWFLAVKRVREKLFLLEKLHLYGGEDAFLYDTSKICILTNDAGLTGYQLYDKLYEQGIVCELAGFNLLLAMTGAGDDEELLFLLADALLKADREAIKTPLKDLPQSLSLPQMVLTPTECFSCDRVKIPLEKAVGQVCAQMVYLYPPGIPMILPGEQVSSEIVDQILFYEKLGVRINGIEGGLSVLVR